MRQGRAVAAERGVPVGPDEGVSPLGRGWLLHDRAGHPPCPWAFDLARFASARPGDRVLDLGCGTGVLLWALAEVEPALGSLVGLEYDAAAAVQAARNATLRGRPALIVAGDLRRLPLGARFDRVVANPPFYPVGHGRESRDPRRHAATHAAHGDVADFARAAAAALDPRGEAIFLFDAGHLASLLLGLAGAGLHPRRLRFLDDDRGRPARVLVAAGPGEGLVVDRRPYVGDDRPPRRDRDAP